MRPVHIAASTIMLALAVVAYLLGAISMIYEAVILILLFPYLSFSIFFYFNKGRDKRKAIDIMRRKSSY